MFNLLNAVLFITLTVAFSLACLITAQGIELLLSLGGL